ncbi:hypothetical protein BGX27_004395 [Mortierella sp. AM989]|nr:hypothetical protein BGX27_004395 [Mortierella sp. AM989]
MVVRFGSKRGGALDEKGTGAGFKENILNAQEYARTIKALWQMVEEEELAYQIDAAATARLAQQQQKQEQSGKDRIRQRYTTFPIPQEYPSTFTLPPRPGHNNDRMAGATPATDDIESRIFPVNSGNIADSEDSDSDDEEDREQKKRGLEDLERQLEILGQLEVLGLQCFQETGDAIDQQITSRRSSHHEQHEPLLPKLQVKQQQQQRVPPPIQTSAPQPYRRRRQNSLTYEERKLQKDTCRQFSKPTSPPITPMASPITPTRGATVNFFDGIVLDEESSDDNDDSVVLSVAHRVSVRLHHHQSDMTSKQDPQVKGMDRSQQKPTWDRARGVSWSPMSKKVSTPTASLPEARLAITTMISAR